MIGHHVDHTAVHLFGPRLLQVAGAQAGFNVRYRYAAVDGGQHRGHRRAPAPGS